MTHITYGVRFARHVAPGLQPGNDAAAALSYYTIFSLPAILVLMLMLVIAVMNPSDVRGGLEGQLQALMGPTAGEQVRTIIQQAEQKPSNGLIPTILGIAGLLFGATGAFGQLRKTLNRLERGAGSEPGRDQHSPHRTG